MTFEEFKASMTRKGRDWLEDELGMEASEGSAGFRVYECDVFIEEIGEHDHMLFIERSVWRTPGTSLEEMERILFDWIVEVNSE